jgi:hypothetical protein
LDQNELGIDKDGRFRFQIPLQLKKSREDGRTYIEGLASQESPDLVGETVIQRGMDLSYFLKRGFFNDNHSKETGAKIGVPLAAEHTPQGLKVKGYLLDTPRAQQIIELAEAIAKSGTDRRLGFSVEGKVQERDGKIIRKSWIKDIAITCEPMHPGTYMTVIKSISERIERDGFVEDEPTSGEMGKTLNAGHDAPPATGGGALRRQDLEGDLKDQDMAGQKADEEEDEASEKDKQKRILTKAQAVELIKLKDYSGKVAEKLAEMIFDSDVRDFLNITQKSQGGEP